MADKIKNIYNVGPGSPYRTVNKALEEIANALFGGDFELPSSLLSDGGQINIVLRGANKFLPFSVPDNMTSILVDYNRYLIIKREEYTTSGQVISDKLAVISPDAPEANLLDKEYLVIGCDLGTNNPNIILRGLRVQEFVIGVRSGTNNNNLHIDRCFITNNSNVQIYCRDSDKVTITNNIAVGGQYGVVATNCKRIRSYHNTVFLDGSTALGGEIKAGMILQGERLFGNTSPSTLYNNGNLIYTIGAPAVIYYDEDIKQGRLISDYNDIFALDAPLVQVRQDSAQLPDEAQIIGKEFYDLLSWTKEAQMSNFTDDYGAPIGLDQHSISAHPIFITSVNDISYENVSILDLTLLNNSPLLGRVPSWYDETINGPYIPSDFNTEHIWKDCLLNIREKPFTAIGANDSPSLNGFFGDDIFTSPLDSAIENDCGTDPLISAASQHINMAFPEILPGYFYSHERKYYLYANKGAYQLGYLIKAEFKLPGFLDKNNLSVKVNGTEIPENDYDIAGRRLYVYTRTSGLTTLDDEVHIDGYIRKWSSGGLALAPVYYRYKFSDAIIKYILPSNFVPSGPVVITDDRVNYRDPIDVVRREFKVEFNEDTQESEIIFGGNKNWIKNAQFDITIDNATPAYWITSTGSRVVLAERDFAHIGDWSCALLNGSGIGTLKSNYVPVESGKPLTYSWHSMFPSVNQSSIVVETGILDVDINFYKSDYTILSGSGESYSFTCEPISYQFTRFYATLEDSSGNIPDNIFESEYAPLEMATGIMQIPYNASYSTIKFSSRDSVDWDPPGWMVVDAVMAEQSNYPTAFIQEEDPLHMTVEFETSTGKFVDKRMNLSPIINENPNGFLYISDMPASIWGGPETLETTTLHEYRWPEGRLFVMPWARMVGKDKLTQKSYFSSTPTEPLDIIEVFNYPKKAFQAHLYPSTVIAVQGDTSAYGINVQVLDDIGNPYALRNYVLSLHEQNDMFPGWLSKRKFGAKEQLGTTVYGQLNERGTAIAYYTPPSAESVRWVGMTPTPLSNTDAQNSSDTISSIKTAYAINPDNNGNITIFGKDSRYIKISDDTPITGTYSIISDNSTGPYVTLQYPPVFGTVSIYVDNTKYFETYGDPQNLEYLVDYENAQIVLSRSTDTLSEVYVSYLPRYAYKDPTDDNTIVFHHNKIFSGYSGAIEIDYDAQIRLEINAHLPMSGEFVDSYYIVAQNSKLSSAFNNSDALEF